MKYRVTTLNGDILGERKTRKEADVLAEQQARRLQESIVIKRKDSDGCYQEVVQIGGKSNSPQGGIV